MVGKYPDIAHAQGCRRVVDYCGKRICQRLPLDRGDLVVLSWSIDRYLGIESLVYQLKWKYPHRSAKVVKSKPSSGTRD